MSERNKYIISQYYESPRLRVMIESFNGLVEKEILQSAIKLASCGGISAKGYWLDLLGRRFGFNRPLLLSVDSVKYFGLTGVPQGVVSHKGTFSQAPFVKSDDDIISNRYYASDMIYSNLLKLWISKMQSTATVDSINHILSSIYPNSYTIDNQDMTLDCYLNISGEEAFDADFILDNGYILPRPAGVAIRLHTFKYFGFDNTGEKFDNGAFG
jgi:hypothetical protein